VSGFIIASGSFRSGDGHPAVWGGLALARRRYLLLVLETRRELNETIRKTS
jgi:hypothetical protein